MKTFAAGDLDGQAMTESVFTTPTRPGPREDLFSDLMAVQTPADKDKHVASQRTFESWLRGAKEVVEKARDVANRCDSSSTAFSRLAQAELIVGNDEAAENAAIAALDLAIQNCSTGYESPMEISAAVSASRILMTMRKIETLGGLLQQLPAHPQLLFLRAVIAVDERKLDEAVSLIGGIDTADAASLLGYIHLVREKPDCAIRELRRGILLDAFDCDIALNLAFAFWRVGSSKKALKSLRYAQKLAPTRKDVVLTLLEFLLILRDLESAEAEIRRLGELRVVEEPELTLMRARIAGLKNDSSKALSFARAALKQAEAAKNTELSVELRARLAAGRLLAGEFDKFDAIREIRASLTKSPKNASLLYLFANVVDSRKYASEVRRYVEALRKDMSSKSLLPLEAQVASLEFSFEAQAEFVIKWADADPLNPMAASQAIMLQGSVLDDWAGAAQRARAALKRIPHSPSLANEAAYVLSCAGDARAAIRVLNKVENQTYVHKATMGLAYLALDRLEEGMALYRRAADLADKELRGAEARALMTLHQGVALRYLGILSRAGHTKIRALALPDVTLKKEWLDSPYFGLIEWVCKHNGWDWPPTVG